MLASHRTDEETTRSNRYIFLKKDFENPMDGTCEQRECFMENGNEKGAYI